MCLDPLRIKPWFCFQTLALLDDEDDINQVVDFFSYEHFYVIYCKFWELDKDHDLFISKDDLAKHNDHGKCACVCVCGTCALKLDLANLAKLNDQGQCACVLYVCTCMRAPPGKTTTTISVRACVCVVCVNRQPAKHNDSN